VAGWAAQEASGRLSALPWSTRRSLLTGLVPSGLQERQTPLHSVLALFHLRDAALVGLDRLAEALHLADQPLARPCADRAEDRVANGENGAPQGVLLGLAVALVGVLVAHSPDPSSGGRPEVPIDF